MPLFTFDNLAGTARFSAGDFITVDTSYVLAYIDENHRHYEQVRDFHKEAVKHHVRFVMNSVVRQELLKEARQSILIQSLLDCAATSTAIEVRYRQAIGIGANAVLTKNNLRGTYDKAFKTHIKQNDLSTLLRYNSVDLWKKLQEWETVTGINFVASQSEDLLWGAVGEVIRDYAVAPTDAQIICHALQLSAKAIVTCDCDFACVAQDIDVYMPYETASQCKVYQANPDFTPVAP